MTENKTIQAVKKDDKESLIIKFQKEHGFVFVANTEPEKAFFSSLLERAEKLSEKKIAEESVKKQLLEESRKESAELDVEGLRLTLRPFQKAGVVYASKAKGAL